MSKYYKLTFPISGEEQQENAIAILNFISNFESIQQEEKEIIVCYHSEKEEKVVLAERLMDIEEFRDYKIEDIEEINWNEQYEKSFQPIELLDKTWSVRASFHEPRNTEYEIIIDPKMSFGTGHHETTKQMMEMLSKENFQGKKVWDYGSGTGILAIMAEKLGAIEVKGNDNEEWAYKNSIENALINGCKNIQFHLGDIAACEHENFLNSDEDRFDVIIANITKNILLESALKIHEYSKPSTILLLSGFYQNDSIDIEKKYNTFNFQIVSQSSVNDWACLKLVKNV